MVGRVGPDMTEVRVLCIPMEINDGGGSKVNSYVLFWIFRGHMGPYGPVWAHMGPAWALEEREKFKKKRILFLRNAYFSKICVF